MSGVEGIVALGIAGNVVQFTDFGVKLCGRIKEYSAAAGAPETLATQVDCISDLLEILKDLSETQKDALEQRIISLCVSKATELSVLLDTFINKGQARNSTWRSVTIAWKSLRAEKKVSELQKALESLLKPLNLNLQAKTV
ncbi:MAG: hypothetical protein M1813_003890 [Trichoglossum hirsutum]|nr:MAG: hypothetical protein M1813_003890 [Trichoglossum hirsutum]